MITDRQELSAFLRQIYVESEFIGERCDRAVTYASITIEDSVTIVMEESGWKMHGERIKELLTVIGFKSFQFEPKTMGDSGTLTVSGNPFIQSNIAEVLAEIKVEIGKQIGDKQVLELDYIIPATMRSTIVQLLSQDHSKVELGDGCVIITV